MFITNYVFIPLMIIFVICLVSAFMLDKNKKETTDKNFRVIKRTISLIFATISLFAHLLCMLIEIPQAITIDFVQMLILIPIAIVLLYINKKPKQN